MNYLITVSYDGSKYNGFQRLNEEESVQKEIEKALSIINKSPVVIKGSGRTDRGVHALGQRCSFKLDVNIPPERLINAINSLVGNYIRVMQCELVDSNFHARFNVRKKTYRYVINMGNYDAIMGDYLYNYNKKLDIKAMKKASIYLIGKHSFKSFVSGYRANYDSEIYKIVFKKENEKLIITFIGKSFYRYMVRNMVGALIMVGEHRLDTLEFKSMIEKPSNKHSNITAPPNGLYLESVEY